MTTISGTSSSSYSDGKYSSKSSSSSSSSSSSKSSKSSSPEEGYASSESSSSSKSSKSSSPEEGYAASESSSSSKSSSVEDGYAPSESSVQEEEVDESADTVSSSLEEAYSATYNPDEAKEEIQAGKHLSQQAAEAYDETFKAQGGEVGGYVAQAAQEEAEKAQEEILGKDNSSWDQFSQLDQQHAAYSLNRWENTDTLERDLREIDPKDFNSGDYFALNELAQNGTPEQQEAARGYLDKIADQSNSTLDFPQENLGFDVYLSNQAQQAQEGESNPALEKVNDLFYADYQKSVQEGEHQSLSGENSDRGDAPWDEITEADQEQASYSLARWGNTEILEQDLKQADIKDFTSGDYLALNDLAQNGDSKTQELVQDFLSKSVDNIENLNDLPEENLGFQSLLGNQLAQEAKLKEDDEDQDTPITDKLQGIVDQKIQEEFVNQLDRDDVKGDDDVEKAYDKAINNITDFLDDRPSLAGLFQTSLEEGQFYDEDLGKLETDRRRADDNWLQRANHFATGSIRDGIDLLGRGLHLATDGLDFLGDKAIDYARAGVDKYVPDSFGPAKDILSTGLDAAQKVHDFQGNITHGVITGAEGLVDGVAQLALDPVGSAQGIAHAIANPIETGKAVWDGYKQIHEEYGWGGVIGNVGFDVAATILTGGAAKGASTAGRVASFAGGFLDDAGRLGGALTKAGSLGIRVGDDLGRFSASLPKVGAASRLSSGLPDLPPFIKNRWDNIQTGVTNKIDDVTRSIGEKFDNRILENHRQTKAILDNSDNYSSRVQERIAKGEENIFSGSRRSPDGSGTNSFATIGDVQGLGNKARVAVSNIVERTRRAHFNVERNVNALDGGLNSVDFKERIVSEGIADEDLIARIDNGNWTPDDKAALKAIGDDIDQRVAKLGDDKAELAYDNGTVYTVDGPDGPIRLDNRGDILEQVVLNDDPSVAKHVFGLDYENQPFNPKVLDNNSSVPDHIDLDSLAGKPFDELPDSVQGALNQHSLAQVDRKRQRLARQVLFDAGDQPIRITEVPQGTVYARTYDDLADAGLNTVPGTGNSVSGQSGGYATPVRNVENLDRLLQDTAATAAGKNGTPLGNNSRRMGAGAFDENTFVLESVARGNKVGGLYGQANGGGLQISPLNRRFPGFTEIHRTRGLPTDIYRDIKEHLPAAANFGGILNDKIQDALANIDLNNGFEELKDTFTNITENNELEEFEAEELSFDLYG